MHGQVHCKQILQINITEGVKDILTNFMLIDENDLKGARLKCSPDKATAAKNMHIALWNTFACPIKMVMQTYANDNRIDAESAIRTYQLNLNILTKKLEMLGYSVDKFCNYATETLKTLCDTGGNNTQASLKLYEALTSSKEDAFNSEIRAYKVIVFAKDKAFDFTKLTAITCTEYTSLVMHGQWPSSQKTATKKRSIDDMVAFKAELKRKEKIIKSFKSLTMLSFLKKPYHPTICHTNKES
eukprot:27780-Ditylum_brightwellii.AAC.1